VSPDRYASRNQDREEKSPNKIIFNNIDTFLTKVDISSKEEWKDNVKQDSPIRTKKSTMFETLRSKQYDKKGLDLRKNFCHQMTTKRITVNLNTPAIIQKEEVKRVSPSLKRITNNIQKLKTDPLKGLNQNSFDSNMSIDGVEFSNGKMRRIFSQDRLKKNRDNSRCHHLQAPLISDDEWRHQFRNPQRTSYVGSRVSCINKGVRKRSENSKNSRFEINLPIVNKYGENTNEEKENKAQYIWKDLLTAYQRMNI